MVFIYSKTKSFRPEVLQHGTFGPNNFECFLVLVLVEFRILDEKLAFGKNCETFAKLFFKRCVAYNNGSSLLKSASIFSASVMVEASNACWIMPSAYYAS